MTDAQEALRQVSEALNKANDASETIGESTWYRKAELRAVCGDAMLDGDRDFIAACSPANIAAILAHVEAQAAEIERLTAERDELRRQLDEAEQDARRYRWIAGHCRSTSEHWGGRWSIIVDGPAPKAHDSEDAFDAAIDAAMRLTRPAEE